MQCHVTVCFLLVPNTNNTFVLWTDNRGCGNFFKLKVFILLDIEKGLLFKGFNFNIREFSDWFDNWDDGPKHELSKVVLCPTSEND